MDTTQIFLLDTAYVRSLVKEVSTSYSFDYIPILVSLISAGAILYANRMTLKRVKGDSFYQSRLNSFAEWETNLKEAAVNFTTTIHTGFLFWLGDTISKEVAVGIASATVESAKILGTNIPTSEMDKVSKVFSYQQEQGLLFMEKANYAVSKLKYMLDPHDEYFKQIVNTSQQLLDINDEIRKAKFENTAKFADFIVSKQGQASPITDTLHSQVISYISAKRLRLEQEG